MDKETNIAGCMVVSNIIGMYFDKKELYTDTEINNNLNNESIEIYNNFIGLQNIIVTMLNVIPAWFYIAKSLNYIFKDIREGGLPPSKTHNETENLFVNQALYAYKNIVLLEYFFKALNEVYNIRYMQELVDYINKNRVYLEKNILNYANQLKEMNEILKTNGLEEIPIIIDLKKPIYQKDYNKLIKAVKNTYSFKTHYFDIVNVGDIVNLKITRTNYEI